MHTSQFALSRSLLSRLANGTLALTLGALLLTGLTGCDAVSAGQGEDASVEAPQGLDAAASDGAVALEWDDVDGATGYHVYRSDASFTDLGDATKVSGNAPLSEAAYADAELTNGTTYYYRVTATGDGDAESDASDEALATPLPSPPARP